MTNKELQAVLTRISENIKYYRNLRGYSQEDMAALGFNYRHFQSIESGKVSFSIETLVRISQVLNIDISDLTEPVKKN